jgi:D-serine/D-alanine/glycine transporter
MFFGMRILGEMLLSNLKFRSFRDLVTHYLGHWAGFLAGWMYWGFWIVTGMQDSVAVSVYLEGYFPDMPMWLPGLAVVLLIFILNSVTVTLFGELEFWLSIIKIVAIVTLIVVGFYMIISGQHFIYEMVSDNGQINHQELQSSLGNLWEHQGFMPHGVTGFLLGFQMAFLAYTGVETIGTTAAEVKDPETTLPRAINSIPLRISIFYVGAIFVILCAVPWDVITNLQGSPFVNIFATIGIPAASIVMTFVLITAAVSGANSGMYSTSRMLFGLAIDGQAPHAFSATSRKDVPQNALSFGFVVIAVPVVLVALVNEDPMSSFTIFAAWATGCVLITWILILLSYFKYIKNYNNLHIESKFKAPFGKVSAGVIIAFFVAILCGMLLDDIPRTGLFLTLGSLVGLMILYFAKVRKVEHVESDDYDIS